MSEEKEYGTEEVTTTNYQASKKGIVALGLYLILMTIFSFAMLVNLMMAETDETKIEKAQACVICNSNTNENTANSNNNSAQNSNGNANIDTNGNANTTTNTGTNTNAVGNANRTNANATNVNANANANTQKNANSLTTTTNANANVKPNATPAEQQFPKLDVPRNVKVGIFNIITADSFLLLIVLSAGMLGALIRGMFSFTRHLGMGDFSFKWTWFYLLLPFTGGALSMVLYLVIRGGFYSSSFGKGLVLNIFSFAALGALTGLFTENAIEKLQQVAEVLLAKSIPKTPNAKK